MDRKMLLVVGAGTDPADRIQSFWQTTTERLSSPLVTDLKPGVFDAPLRGCGALTSATSGEAGIHAVDADWGRKVTKEDGPSKERVMRSLAVGPYLAEPCDLAGHV